MRGGGDVGPQSASSSSSMPGQELNLLMPGSVSWWPKHGWEPWLQRNVAEATREFNGKLDVTPESNDTSTSEVA